jgi:hypothetical protein
VAQRGNVPGRDDTFDAGQYGTLRYDFKKFGGVQGIIPDPSDEMIEEYMRNLRDIAREFGEEDVNDDATPEEIQALLEDDSNMQIAEAQKRMAEATGAFCQGSPDAAALLALPFRVRTGFMRWLQRKIMDPEASAAGTSPVRAIRHGG